jgi:hypothetical protein
MPATPLTFRRLTSKHLERTKLKLALALCNREGFQQFGPHAIRHLTDNVTPSLAEPVIGGKVVRCPRVGGLVNHYARVA